MATFIREVLKGIQAGIAEEKDALERLRKSAKLAAALASELTAAAALTPFGLRALRVMRLLPTACTPEAAQPTPLGVVLFPNIRYGPAPRQLLDIYVPQQLYQVILQRQQSVDASNTATASPSTISPDSSSGGTPIPSGPATSSSSSSSCRPTATTSGSSSSSLPSAPVVFFCHGGIWATGEGWHFSPMATCLAQAGCVVVVITYTLYPDALATAMACEVLQGLLWTLNNAGKFLGDPRRVTVMGHSAGGHLGALALLLLAEQRHQEQQQQQLARQGEEQQQGWRGCMQQQQQQGAQQQQDHPRVWQAWEQQAASSTPPAAAPFSTTAPAAAAMAIGDAAAAVAHAAGNGPDTNSSSRSGGASSTTPDSTSPAAMPPSAAAGVTQEPPLWLLQAPATATGVPLPLRFIGMSGVYDVPKHFEYEMSRGVHHLSTMARACGGFVQMADVSPVRILQRACNQQQTPHHHYHQQQQQGVLQQPPLQQQRAAELQEPAANVQQQQDQTTQVPPAADTPDPSSSSNSSNSSNFYAGFALAGEAIPMRAGLGPAAPVQAQPRSIATASSGSSSSSSSSSNRGSGGSSSSSNGGSYASSSGSQEQCSTGFASDHGTAAAATEAAATPAGPHTPLGHDWHAMNAAAALRSFTRTAAQQQLPPFILMSSCSDHMVPWHEAAEMAAALQAAGVPLRHLIYNQPSHNDFVLDWPVVRSAAGGGGPTTDVAAAAAAAGVIAGPAAASAAGGSVANQASVAAPATEQQQQQQQLESGMLQLAAEVAASGVPPFADDVIKIVTGQVQVQYQMSRL